MHIKTQNSTPLAFLLFHQLISDWAQKSLISSVRCQYSIMTDATLPQKCGKRRVALV